MLDVMMKISTVFVMIFIGFGACKIGLIDVKANKYLTSMVLNINIPCMLLCSITNNEISDDSLNMTIVMLCFSAAYFAAAAVVAIFLVKVFRIKEINDIGVYKIFFTSINAGFIGFPLTKVLFGDGALYFMILHNIILNIFLYSICVLQLSTAGSGKQLISQTAKKMVNPCIISALLAIVMLFSGLHMPSYISNVLQPLGDAAIPVAMIVIGIQLAEGRIKDLLNNKKLISFSVIRMLIWPCVILLIVKWMSISELIKIVLILGAALPPATIISALAAEEGKNYKLAADGIIVTTLLSMITIPIVSSLIYSFL